MSTSITWLSKVSRKSTCNYRLLTRRDAIYNASMSSMCHSAMCMLINSWKSSDIEKSSKYWLTWWASLMSKSALCCFHRHSLNIWSNISEKMLIKAATLLNSSLKSTMIMKSTRLNKFWRMTSKMSLPIPYGGNMRQSLINNLEKQKWKKQKNIFTWTLVSYTRMPKADANSFLIIFGRWLGKKHRITKNSTIITSSCWWACQILLLGSSTFQVFLTILKKLQICFLSSLKIISPGDNSCGWQITTTSSENIWKESYARLSPDLIWIKTKTRQKPPRLISFSTCSGKNVIRIKNSSQFSAGWKVKSKTRANVILERKGSTRRLIKLTIKNY